jgi:alpha-methylacyl-CoA racemase
MSSLAGHDLNYVALGGPLGMFGRDLEGPLVPPLNLLGDFAGGAVMCVVGVLASLLGRNRSGVGSTVDASMAEGVSYLSTFIYHLRSQGSARSPIPWTEQPGSNVLNGAAPFYDVYRTRDAKQVSFAAIEPEFFAQMIQGLRLPQEWLGRQNDREGWPELRKAIATAIGSRTRDELDAMLAPYDGACYAPVLDLDEARDHPQHRCRAAFRQIAGQVVPAPSPIVDARSDAPIDRADSVGQSTVNVLIEAGLSREDVDRLLASGAAWSEQCEGAST